LHEDHAMMVMFEIVDGPDVPCPDNDRPTRDEPRVGCHPGSGHQHGK